jgi:hypothetical protein
MFEKLTRQEAQKLSDMLADAYTRSRRVALNARAAWIDDPAHNDSGRYYRVAGSQSAMRSEITAIRWQIKQEALS